MTPEQLAEIVASALQSMVASGRLSGEVPELVVVNAFDVSMILYAEHSFNASTFTARVIASTLSGEMVQRRALATRAAIAARLS